MSRTDIHRPTHVLAQDPTMREHFKEFHHHTEKDDQGNLICDFEVFMAAYRAGRWVRTNCYLMWWSELQACGCKRCTAQASRRRTRRRDRHNIRRANRVAFGQAAAGDLDEDGPQIPWAGGLWD